MKTKIKKIYSDFITSSGLVGIIYLIKIELVGIQKEYASLELYPKNQPKRVFQAQSYTFRVINNKGDRNMIICLKLPYGEFNINYSVKANPSLLSFQDPPGIGLIWEVLIPRAKVVINWKYQDRILKMKGQGYSDYVELSKIPKTLQLHTLKWGRLHNKVFSVVFTDIEYSNKKSWRRIMIWEGDNLVLETEDFQINNLTDQTIISLKNGSISLPSEIHINHKRILHHGQALNFSRIPGVVERLFYNFIGGKIRENRYLSILDYGNSTLNQDIYTKYGNSINEVVKFGD